MLARLPRPHPPASRGYKIDQGVKKDEQAEAQHKADSALVEKEKYTLDAAKLAAQMEKLREELKKVLESLDSNWQLASKVFSDEKESHDLLNANFNAPRTV